ncbi:CYFA0S02e05182g1_1 [Cyberlindnera fabianii]|uniref:General negative regulator of transcription subunit n=1 Tax=Cyberlindnera fabianii TaxID=36022 RepID=A0A061AMA8_CYBFA|nr:CYFA0S02e05182g1_1 [Cyberlindnera fabianii]
MAQRKLQQEIDKVFKKVKEGLEVFDMYYDKLQMCESQPQKEKLESDLKKEIKKLQRQRDQIKNWASGNDVKDKKPLLENRRMIENAMERFKEVEKNMKTKAFSKEGLNMQRIDPKQKEKEETSEFLQLMLDELERQNEKHEALIDQVQSSGKKGKRLDSSKQSEVDDLQEKIDRNHWHQEKLEQILRMIANDALDCEKVNELQEDIQYYVDSNEDADFLEDEFLYEDLDLDNIEESYGTVGEFPTIHQDDFMETATASNTPKKNSVSGSSTQNTAPSTAGSSVQPPHPPVATPSKVAPPPGSATPSKSVLNTPATAVPPIAMNLKPALPQKTELKYASVASAAVAHSNHNTPKTASAILNSASANGSSTSLSKSVQQSPVVPPPGLGAPSTTTTPVISYANISSKVPDLVPTPIREVEEPKEDGSVDSKRNEAIAKLLGREAIQKDATGDAIADLIEPYSQVKDYLMNPAPFEEISKILETSLLNCPDSLDSDKPRSYRPQNPHPSPIHYPQDPLPELSFTSIVSKLDISTLFFNFYYNQGDYIQILSARELVKKGWQFDKISQKWYQEVEEIQPPSLIGEQLTGPEKRIAWKYFDNEGVWLPRRKDDFDVEKVEWTTTF